MKAIILNSISEKSANFENKVSKLLPEGINEIYLSSCGMTWLGRGSYSYILKIGINNEVDSMTLTRRTTDSMYYDYYKSLDYGSYQFNNWVKNTALMLLEENKDRIIEFLSESVES